VDPHPNKVAMQIVEAHGKHLQARGHSGTGRTVKEETES